MSDEWTIGQTCLVIGAGAHVPYGFPTGKELRDQILRMKLAQDDPSIISMRGEFVNLASGLLRDKTLLNKIYLDLKTDESHSSKQKYESVCDHYDKDKLNEANKILIDHFLDSFITNFKNTYFASIDRYLTTINDLNETKIGKMLIAYLIFRAEENAIEKNYNQDWIEEIINNFINTPENLEKFYNSGTKIITFNYDNLFEKKLISNLIHGYKKTPTEAQELVSRLNIVHVYGDIKSFDNDISKVVRSANDNLKMVSERQLIDRKVKEYLSHSDMIMFLGFGFDNENLKLLFDQTVLKSNVKIKTTNIGFDSNMKTRLFSYIKRLSKIENFEGQIVDCLKIIKFHYNAPSSKSRIYMSIANGRN